MKFFKILGVEIFIILFCLLPFFIVPRYSSLEARGQEALLRFGQFCLIDDEKRWQEILLNTDYGRNIKNPRELNDVLIQLNQHSSATALKKTTTVKEFDDFIGNHNLPRMVKQDDFTVIEVPSMYTYDEDFNEAYTTELFKFIMESDSKIVLDLRDNVGGDFIPMITGASSLIPDGKILEVLDNKQNSYPIYLAEGQLTGGMNNLLTEGVRPRKLAKATRKISKEKMLDKKVAVLTDEYTASAAEFLLLALKNNPNVKTFGIPSAGYTSWNDIFFFERRNNSYVWLMNATNGYLRGTFGKKEVFRNTSIMPDFPLRRTFKSDIVELDDYTKNEIHKWWNE